MTMTVILETRRAN